MDLAKSLARLDDGALSEFFSNSAIAKAHGYLSRVREIERTGDLLRAKVQGSDYAPYAVSIRLENREFFGTPSLEIATRCTCPVGNRCKHAAALLMAVRKQGLPADKPRSEVLQWAAGLKKRIDTALRAADKPQRPRDAIFYVISVDDSGDDANLRMLKVAADEQGRPKGGARAWDNVDQALVRPPTFVQESDLDVFRALLRHRRKRDYYGDVRLHGASGAALLEAVLATGRTWAGHDYDDTMRPLQRAAPRAGHLIWRNVAAGLAPVVTTEPVGGIVLPTEPLYYLDLERGEIGRVELAHAEVVLDVLRLPPLTENELPLVAAALADVAPALPATLPGQTGELEELVAPLEPVLTIDTLTTWGHARHRDYEHTFSPTRYDYALATFRYGGAELLPGATQGVVSLPDGRAVRLKRDSAAENAALAALERAGLKPVRPQWLRPSETRRELGLLLGLASEVAWTGFFAEQVAALRQAGWHIDCPADFRHRVLAVTDWDAELEEDANGWFSLSLGIEVEGRQLELAPLLHQLFRREARWLDPKKLEQIGNDESVIVFTEAGERIAIPAQRIKPLARTLVDLFDAPEAGALRVSRFDAPRLAEALDENWRTRGMQPLEDWHARIRKAQGIERVEPPQGLAIELRPYQREGLAWLQHLRTNELAGILADDMGLGKTAQALAHLLAEKQAGRLDRPTLVVLPTSLIFNWKREAERFAPDLSVLKLQGKSRGEAFAQIPHHDICLTTYPLLWRDREHLAAHAYHYVILDEAQTVKNAASQAAQVVRQLDARHRLCLTGTPLENHLGELWSQFDFLLPGFLGAAKDFTSRWRTPIEKRGDALRARLLAQRVAPFILRRKKEDVAKELPPKTIVLRTVELQGRQRDLYETVRSAMDKRVREEIAARGFARSQIVILDALLKLRQVCCDPRLLKLPAAEKVKERAKLDLLMEMLPELVEEGRRVLVFSQFTRMLALIEAELNDRGIGYSLLTGQTQKREAAIAKFQDGAVPVFLISLKAGGVGLNLTAADTVIHYDPWWNPAVENQATDRAHRIGQTKNVFVYKLIAAGSIEEKILALQEKKAELAAGILNEDRESMAKFGEDDIRDLLAALPE
jgi:superfamily II DNA or RNA helicase